jgi:outer membrane protein TolC
MRLNGLKINVGCGIMQRQKRYSTFIFVNYFLVLFIRCSLSIAQSQALNFDDALNIAIKNSPDIQQARLSLERSQELLNAENASLKSRFSLNLDPFSFNRAQEFDRFNNTWNTSEVKSSSGLFTVLQPLLWTDGTLALRNQFSWQNSFSEFQGSRLETYSNNLYLSYDQPIFTYNRTRLALEEVQLDKENAQINYNIRELLLEQLVAQSFYNTYQNTMALLVAKEDYQNRMESYQIIKNKVDAGLAAQEELYQAELNLTSSKSDVQNQQVTLDNSLDELKQTIGLSLFDDITVVADISMDSVKVDLQQAQEFGLQNRFELRQRNIDINIARANLTRAAATNEFKGNISLSYGIIGNNEQFKNVYETPTRNQRVNLSLEIPIWDWGESESRTKAAQSTIQKSELSLDEEKNSITIAIRKAYRSLQNQMVQLELARQNVKSALLTYDINLERYENGDLTSMDLNLFQNQLSQKKIGLINAMISYKMNLLELKIESLWDFEKNQPAILIEPD